MANILNNTNSPTLTDHLEHGDIEKVSRLSGLNRNYVSECLTTPEKFKGSSTAKEKILTAFEKVLAERQANAEAAEAAQARLAKLLNEAEVL